MQKLRVQKRCEAVLVEHHIVLVVLKQGDVIVEDCDADLCDFLGGAGCEGQSGVVEIYGEDMLEAVG